MSIERPYELVSLPLPLDRVNGRSFVSAVHGVSSGGRPRKRPKLAVGIDGEGVNIYDIHPVKLDSSYSLPPQSKFTCAPCCVHQKLKGRGTQKSTYASVRDPSAKIIRFSETARQDSESVDESSSSFDRRELEDEGEVVQILPWLVNEAVNVLVVYSDGLLQCLSSDLSAEIWRASLKSGPALQAFKTGNVQSVELHTTEDLTEGLFRNRPDMLVSLEGHTDVVVLSAIISNSTADKIAVYTIQTGGIFTNVSCLSLQYLELPIGVSKRQGQAHISLNLKRATVMRTVGNRFLCYDISGPEPVRRFKAAIGDGDCSLLPLSDFAVLLATKDEFSMLNTTYGSIYTKQSASLDGIKLSRKRKREDSAAQVMQLLDYFPSENLVVAKIDNILVGIQVSLLDSSRRKLTGGLVDAIARGTILFEQPLTSSASAGSERIRNKVEKTIDKLQRAVASKDSQKFERRVASALDIKRVGEALSGKDDQGKANGKLSNGKHNLHNTQLPAWILPAKPAHIPPLLGSYLESTLFSYEDGKFNIAFDAPNVLKYMIESGGIEIWRIYSSHRLPEPNGSLCIALTEQYPDLLNSILNSPISLPVGELLGLIRQLLPNNNQQVLLTAVTSLHRSYQSPAITRAMRTAYSAEDLSRFFTAVSHLFLAAPTDESLSATLSILTSLLDASAFAFTLPIEPVHSGLTPLIADLNSCVSLRGALESVLEYSKHASAPAAKGRRLLQNSNGVVSTFSPGEESGSALPLDTLSSGRANTSDNVRRMVGKYSIERIEV